jgi:hypothetical protein
MKKWMAILIVLLSLGLSMPVCSFAGAPTIQKQIIQNQINLLNLWLNEESVLISNLMEIDRRLGFRLTYAQRANLIQAKKIQLERLNYVRGQIYNLSMQLYGRPRP